MTTIQLTENGLGLAVAFNESECPRLVYFGRAENLPSVLPSPDAHHQLVSVQGEKQGAREYSVFGLKQHLTSPGADFAYEAHRDDRNSLGRKLEIDLRCHSLGATVHWQFFDGIPVLRSWLEIRNAGDCPHGLEQAASFFFHGISQSGTKPWNEKSRVYFCINSWSGEMRWNSSDLCDLGLDRFRNVTSNRVRLSNSGTWSTKEYLPMGLYENTESRETVLWQIETSGSWNWEIGDSNDQLYLLAQGPNEADNHWFRSLAPGASFQTVPVAVGIVEGGFNEAIAALTRYRRKIRRPHRDNERLPVIFNDYMNCLLAEPTTEKELPYIAAAKELGAEVYVIDAGWYAGLDENWWSSVGEWQPSRDRFEGGIEAILQTIRDHGMIPGLWLELEVMGVDCPLAMQWPPECFFRRHGQPVVSRGRYQLDFRHPTVIAHANEVIDRLVNLYGVGFIKMDYNIDAGIGTEVDADSFGDGLLRHNRAYLAWLDDVLERHPILTVENCSSGGLRMDYALLARHPLQSLTDQEDVVKLARIAAIGASGVTPEQLGVWVYPKKEESRENVILNCVNGLLGRFYLSGEIANLSSENTALVREAIQFHKEIRSTIPASIPFWPLGLPKRDDQIVALGLRHEEGFMLAVWNFSAKEQDIAIPILNFDPGDCRIHFYPKENEESPWSLKPKGISVCLPPGPCARAVSIASA